MIIPRLTIAATIDALSQPQHAFIDRVVIPTPPPIPTIVIPNQYVAMANSMLVVNTGEDVLNKIVKYIAEYCADLLSYGGQTSDLVLQITRVLSHKHDLENVNIYSTPMAEFINNVAYDIVSVLILNKTHTDLTTQSSGYQLVAVNTELIIFSKNITTNPSVFSEDPPHIRS